MKFFRLMGLMVLATMTSSNLVDQTTSNNDLADVVAAAVVVTSTRVTTSTIVKCKPTGPVVATVTATQWTTSTITKCTNTPPPNTKIVTVTETITATTRCGGTKPTATTKPNGSCSRSYTIVSGDTCWAISQTSGLGLSSFLACNPGIVCENLQIGQVVCIDCSGGPTNPPVVSGGSGKFRVAPYYELVNSAANPALQSMGLKHVTLAFIIANSQNQPSFEGEPLSSYDGIIRNFQGSGGRIIISFGGAAGQELATVIKNEDALYAAYKSVIDRYNCRILDFDIEGSQIGDGATNNYRNKVLARLQRDYNGQLEIMYTLAVSPSGLPWDQLQLLRNCKAQGLTVSTVNLMTMDYYDGKSILEGSKRAIEAAWAQIQTIDATMKIGVTPMIGKNDDGAIITVAEIRALLQFSATKPYVSHVAFWAAARDRPGSELWNSAGIYGFNQGDYTNAFKAYTA